MDKKKKRYRVLRAKQDEVRVGYALDEDRNGPDIVYGHGGHTLGGSTARLLIHFFERVKYDAGSSGPMNLRRHLIDRGYDISTLKFSIRKTKTES